MNRTVLAMFLVVAPMMDMPWPEVRPAPQVDDGGRARIMGAWRLVERIEDGAVPELPFRGGPMTPFFLVIDDDRYINIPLHYGRPTALYARVWDLTLDTRQTPNAFDITFRTIGNNVPVEPEHRFTRRGIWRVDGDRLITCTGPTRPTDFAVPAGSKRIYSVYQRVEPRGPAARPAPGAAAELARLAGTYAQVREVDEGGEVSRDNFEWKRMKIEGDRIFNGEVKEDGRMEWYSNNTQTFAVDPGSTPKAIDFISRGGVVSRWVVQAIYRLEGDTLTFCFGPRERPTEFTTPDLSDRSLVVYRRVKADGQR